jgi:hypothetical protein
MTCVRIPEARFFALSFFRKLCVSERKTPTTFNGQRGPVVGHETTKREGAVRAPPETFFAFEA